VGNAVRALRWCAVGAVPTWLRIFDWEPIATLGLAGFPRIAETVSTGWRRHGLNWATPCGRTNGTMSMATGAAGNYQPNVLTRRPARG